MGYRLYFALANKTDVARARDMHTVELSKGCSGGPDAFRAVLEHQIAYELGDADEVVREAYKTGSPLFSDEAMMKVFDDLNPYIVGIDGLKSTIAAYKDKTLRYHQKLYASTEELSKLKTGEPVTQEHLRQIEKLRHAIACQISELGYSDYVNTDEDEKFTATGSWDYNYAIFNLVLLLKTTDWETKELIIYGY